VVSAGTATTIDMLTGDGHFLGGLILPGLDLMQRALAGNTAQLRLADGHYAERPTTTADAITSGTLQATLGAVERQYRILQEQVSSHTVLCLLTGGAAPRLAPYLSLPHRAEPQLVLEGLACLEP
jgi:type III pantothenate kinase